MKNLLTQFWNNEDGVTAIEYALIGVAMAVVVGTAVSGSNGLKKQIGDAFTKINGAIQSAAQ